MSGAPDRATELTPENAVSTLVGHVCRYFERVGGVGPELLAPSIERGRAARLAKTGYMAVSGAAEGWVALSMPDRMLHGLLDRMGEPLRDSAALLDLTAEMAGAITSNARAEYGERLRVAPPFAIEATASDPALVHPPLVLKLPFRWGEAEAFLLIALLPNPARSP